jgi:hypothetical protein
MCLTNVYRQTDPVLRDILGRLRDGNFTEEDLATLNSRVVGEGQPGSVDLEGLVAVLGNAAKEHVTALQQNAWFKYRGLLGRDGTPVLPVMLIGAYSRAMKPIADKNLLKQLSHTALGVFRGRPGKFLASVGMPVIFGDRITYTDGKKRVKVAAANGSTGRIYGFQFPPGTKFEIVVDEHDQPSYIMPSKQVKYVLVQVNNPQFPQFVDLPPGVLPVKPSSQAGKEALKTTHLKQVPLSPNFGSTCHKLQSQTLDVLTIAEFSTKDPSMQRVMHGSHIYVLLSRVRTLQGLFLLKPITWKDIRYFYSLLPSYKTELTRLEQLAQVSRSSFPNPCPVAPDLTVPTEVPTGAGVCDETGLTDTELEQNSHSTNSNSDPQRQLELVGSRKAIFPGKDVARFVQQMNESVANRSETSNTSRVAAAPYVPYFARLRTPSTLLQCTAINHVQFATIYKYNMETAPPTGEGVYGGPLDSTFANDTSRGSMFSWLYMPLLLNALLPSTPLYFASFVTAMPLQYRMLVCYYRRFFQQQKITWSHAAATPDGPLHFSQDNQELMMNLPATSDGSVSPRLYCETLVGLLFHIVRHPNIQQTSVDTVSINFDRLDQDLLALFPGTPHGFPFTSCETASCVLCGSSSGPRVSTSSRQEMTAVHEQFTNVTPHRRLHGWNNNSCYVDSALQTWYHILDVASVHYGYAFNSNNFREFDIIPEVLQLNFFPVELQRGLWEWLQCKLALTAATTNLQVIKY